MLQNQKPFLEALQTDQRTHSRNGAPQEGGKERWIEKTGCSVAGAADAESCAVNLWAQYSQRQLSSNEGKETAFGPLHGRTARCTHEIPELSFVLSHIISSFTKDLVCRAGGGNLSNVN